MAVNDFNLRILVLTNTSLPDIYDLYKLHLVYVIIIMSNKLLVDTICITMWCQGPDSTKRDHLYVISSNETYQWDQLSIL